MTVNNRKPSLILVCCLLLCSGMLDAVPDDTQQAWLEQLGDGTHWVQIKGAPQWVAGVAPRFSAGRLSSAVTLGPGDSTTLRIPADERLLIQHYESAEKLAGLRIDWSNGSGLFASLRPQQASGGRSLLARPPTDSGTDILLRIANPAAEQPIEFALFRSENLHTLSATSYRELLQPVSGGRRIKLDREKVQGETYWQAGRDSPLTLELDGEFRRVRVASRLLYPDREGPFADSYRISVYLDGAPWQVLDLATLLDVSAKFSIDGCNQPLGRQVYGYLDLPIDAERIEFRVQRPMLLSLSARSEPDDYLYPGNRPLGYPDTIGASGGQGQEAFFWGRTAAALKTQQGDLPGPNSASYLDSVRVAKDNAHLLGGIAALRPLADWAKNYPGQPRYRLDAARRRVLHTHYRDLLPSSGSGTKQPVFAWFQTPSLQRDARPRHVPEGYAQSLAGNLASGFFHPVPARGDGELAYLLPERLQPLQLRVAVDGGVLTAPETFYIQMDGAQPLRFELEPGDPVKPAGMQAGTGTDALSLLQTRSPVMPATLSGAFAARRPPAPLAAAAFLEVTVEQAVRKLKIWRANPGKGNLQLALAYRSSGWYRMSEPGYLALHAAVGQAAVLRLFQRTIEQSRKQGGSAEKPGLRSQTPAASEQQDLERELYNQWLPLLRNLYHRSQAFTAGVGKPAADNGVPQRADRDAVKKIQQQAQAAENRKAWHSALEKWSWLQRHTTAAAQERARLGQVTALRQLGNTFLARQLLKRDVLYGSSPSQRQRALRQLIELAQSEQDTDRLVTLRTMAMLAYPTVENIRDLAEALAAAGQNRAAVQLLLVLPAPERPQRLLLETAYQLGWWSLFETALAGSGDDEFNALWRGYKAQFKGDYAAAQQYWSQAGQHGLHLSDQLASGLDIRDRLASRKQRDRIAAVLDWEAWQGAMPDAGTWQSTPQSVVGHAGVAHLRSIAQGKISSRFQASPDQPLRIAVYGPARLRLEVRPLHSANSSEPINDWVGITSVSGTAHHPIIDNRVSQGLRLAGDNERRPGRRIEILQQLPAGYQELELRAGRQNLLVGVSRLQPRLPLTVLPPLTPYTVGWVLAGGYVDTVFTPLPNKAALVPPQRVVQCSQNGAVISDLGRTGRGTGIRGMHITPPAAAWFEQLESERSRPVGPRKQPVAAGAADQSPSLKQLLSQLLWEAEQNPESYGLMLARAEQLAEGDSMAAGIEPILNRMRRRASWQLVTAAQESAGMRLISFNGWQPETPALKTRKAIMAQQVTEEQVVSGYDAQLLSMYNLQPAQITIRLSMMDAALQPAQGMRVLLAWDDLPEQAFRLTPAEPELVLTSEAGVGHHLLRVRIDRPLANQFLKVRISEQRSGQSLVITEPVQRSYLLATEEQPLVLLLKGPARLRIDEWRDGRTLTSYRTLDAGWQETTISPEAGQEEALLRVFRQTIDIDKPATRLRSIVYTPQTIAAARWPPVQEQQSLEEDLTETPAADWLPEGTWSVTSGLVSRRYVDEQPQESTEEERFTALGGGYRYFSAFQDTYYQADARVRLREHGDPTLALHGHTSVRKDHWPLDVDVSGSLFAQHLDQTGQVETAATLRGRVSRSLQLGEKISHRPSISAFQRWLSLSSLPDKDPQKVDQDLFSDYKDDHSRGWRLGDRIQYRPWLDTVIYSSAFLTSNEDFDITDPDHLGLNLGARQLLGDLGVGLRYSRTEYFEDDDRDRDSDTQRFRFDLGYSRWFSARRGLQANLLYEYDHDSADSSVLLTFSLNRSSGRFYRDFRPTDLDFRQLRQRRALEQRSRPRQE